MMWSLIIIICVGTPEGATCLEAKWHGIADRLECLRMRNEYREKLEETEPLHLIARCEQGWFG